LSPYPERLKALRGLIKGPLLVGSLESIRYLSGFTGSWALLLVLPREAFLLTDARYIQQAQRELMPQVRPVLSKGSPLASLRRLLRGYSRLGFEETITYKAYERLRRLNLKLVPTRGLVESLRAQKDQEELALIRKAIRVAEEAFVRVLPAVRAGVQERRLCVLLKEALLELGSEALPFEPVVASGPNAALPHARATERRLRPGEVLLIDWGARVGGYCSDMTRVLLSPGPGAQRWLALARLLRQAQRAALRALGPGATGAQIDKAARDVIKKAGYGEHFGHGLGHGVGLQVHELPRLSPQGRAPLRQGMVFTIEPGVYLLGQGGLRLEDMVYLGPSGPSVLTHLPRDPLALRRYLRKG
jgi:Xaa-Pro aminopeptidase